MNQDVSSLACARCGGYTFCYLDLFRHVCYISFSWCYCVCLKHNPLCNCLCSSSFLPAVSGTSKFKLVFLILKIWKCGGLKSWAQHFPRYSCKIWYKNWYLHFCKTYDHQIWQAGTSAGFDSNETYQAGAGDKSDILKILHFLYQSAYGHQTWKDGNLDWWAPAHKVKWPFDHVTN